MLFNRTPWRTGSLPRLTHQGWAIWTLFCAATRVGRPVVAVLVDRPILRGISPCLGRFWGLSSAPEDPVRAICGLARILHCLTATNDLESSPRQRVRVRIPAPAPCRINNLRDVFRNPLRAKPAGLCPKRDQARVTAPCMIHDERAAAMDRSAQKRPKSPPTDHYS